MNRSFRANVPGVPFEPAANLTFTLGSDGAERERRECLDTFEVVRLRDIIGAGCAAVSGVLGTLHESDRCASGDGVLGLPPASPRDV